MSKRPAEQHATNTSKKTRINPELEAMKATLDSLVSSARTHHEEARIAAIDAAGAIEEEWTVLSTEKDTLHDELLGVSSECEQANTYLETFENSTTVQMLRKASETKVVENLVDDNERMTDTLTKLRNLSDRLTTRRKKTETDLADKTTECDFAKQRLDAAEKKIETITNFNKIETITNFN